MNLPSLLELVTWRDLLDVGVVAILFYNLLLLIRGTRAVQMLSGLLFAALLFFVARTTGLLTLEAIIEKVLIFLPFAIIVLFQQEIRRALVRLGRNPLLGRRTISRLEATVEESALAVAATSSASRLPGASTGSSTPVRNRASALARNTATFATSSGSHILPSGIVDTKRARFSALSATPMKSLSRPVGAMTGEMRLTRMPSAASSAAALYAAIGPSFMMRTRTPGRHSAASVSDTRPSFANSVS